MHDTIIILFGIGMICAGLDDHIPKIDTAFIGIGLYFYAFGLKDQFR